jgi:hypothetical protein
LHQAVDLASGRAVSRPTAGASWSSAAGSDTTSVSIDHTGHAVAYNHITDVSSPRAASSVRATDRPGLGRAGRPHAHFRLWAVIDRKDLAMTPATATWCRSILRPLRMGAPARRRRAHPLQISPSGSRLNTVHFFFARFESDVTPRARTSR